ncbi:MAG: hypothetical protein LBP65_00665 [Puniceicoccales bacterium]|jgi:hypothetical protein|nr:hypothetical protein [Puniceicoccales bacterium]
MSIKDAMRWFWQDRSHLKVNEKGEYFEENSDYYPGGSLNKVHYNKGKNDNSGDLFDNSSSELNDSLTNDSNDEDSSEKELKHQTVSNTKPIKAYLEREPFSMGALLNKAIVPGFFLVLSLGCLAGVGLLWGKCVTYIVIVSAVASFLYLNSVTLLAIMAVGFIAIGGIWCVCAAARYGAKTMPTPSIVNEGDNISVGCGGGGGG